MLASLKSLLESYGLARSRSGKRKRSHGIENTQDERQERDYRSPQRQRAIYVRAHTVCEKRAVGINAWKSEKRTQAERMCDEGCMRLRGVIEN